MNTASIQEWHKLPEVTRKNIFAETAKDLGLPDAAVEKDWWVVRALELVFDTSIAPHTVFKGGTSLSKAWGLIDRFSEDIDLALDRKFLGFEQKDHEMTGSQVRKLREKSSKFIAEVYFKELEKKFSDAGFKDFEIRLGEVKTKDQEPLIIEIYYSSVTEKVSYLPPRILIEVGSRSMREPFEHRGIDYKNHTPDNINPIPPLEKIADWEADYKIMQESMMYKSSLSFEKLIGRIRELKDRINQL